MMTVISHRGYWKEPSEKNLEVAFRRSFDLGFGTETDIRDSLHSKRSTLVISHDPPSGGEMALEDVFRLVNDIKMRNPSYKLPLAINIKADGLEGGLKPLLEVYEIKDYFLFDMSIAGLLGSTKAGMRCYTRLTMDQPGWKRCSPTLPAMPGPRMA